MEPREFSNVDDLLTALANDPALTYVNVPAKWVDGKKVKLERSSIRTGGRTAAKKMFLEMLDKKYLVIAGAESIAKYTIKVR